MNRHIVFVATQCIAMVWISLGYSQTNTDRKISMYGMALPKNQVTLRSSIDRQVSKIYVQEGQNVKAGDLLVLLACEPAKARRNIAKLAAEETGPQLSAAAELEFAQKNFDRINKLFSQDAVNQNELSESSLRLRRAEASYQMEIERKAASQARYELANAELEEYYLRAPFDGQITSVSANPGDPVTSDTDILQLISMDQFRMELYLPYEQARDVRVGQSCSLQVQSPFENRQVQGTVAYRSPVIESTTGTLRFVFEIDNREHQLPAGFTAYLSDL